MSAKKTVQKPKPRMKVENRRCRTCNWWCVVSLHLPYNTDVDVDLPIDPMTLRQECRGTGPRPSDKVVPGESAVPYRAWPRTDPDDGERCRMWEPREK